MTFSLTEHLESLFEREAEADFDTARVIATVNHDILILVEVAGRTALPRKKRHRSQVPGQTRDALATSSHPD